ncbi:VP11 [Banna-like virus strain Balaton/2010/HUN]|nr:VP11 [Banna-like virus strain Balaton/2010/HUN]
MDPISVIHEFARANKMTLNFETVGVRGPAHAPQFQVKCNMLGKEYKATASTKKGATRNVCILISSDLNTSTTKAAITDSVSRSLATTYGEIFEQVMNNSTDSITTNVRLLVNPPLLQTGSKPPRLGTSWYIYYHLLACYLMTEMNITSDVADDNYLNTMTDQVLKRTNIKLNHQTDDNITITLSPISESAKCEKQLLVTLWDNSEPGGVCEPGSFPCS